MTGTRTHWNWLLALGAALWLAACASGGAAETRATEVAPGVYLMRGAGGEMSPANRGRVGNSGFIVGTTGVLAIDTGTSYHQGRQLLAEIARVTDKPVRRVLITHTRQEFLFGAAAFRERGIPVQMQRQAALLMAARCEGCLKTLKRVLGDEEMSGSAVVTPDLLFDESLALDVIGRPVRLLAFGHSSGPGDTAVFDEQSGALFAGGLLDQGYVPDVQDSDLPGWHAALSALRKLPVRTVVPGHGPATKAQAIDTVEHYLTQLEARMRELIDAGASLSEAPDRAGLPEFSGWEQYDNIHRRNASIVYLRLEREQLFRSSREAP